MVVQLLEDKETFIFKLAGKNNVKPQHRTKLCAVVDAIVPILFTWIVLCLKYKRVVLVSEGDNLENDVETLSQKYTPFSDAQLKFITLFHTKGVETHFLLLKLIPSASGFSTAFVDEWKRGLCDACGPEWFRTNVFFGITEQYSALTFQMSHLVVFLGTTMCDDYMYKTDENGTVVPTTGYKHFMDMENNPKFEKGPDVLKGNTLMTTFYDKTWIHTRI